MKRVLSLLLLIPFLTVQAWALRGGPYDGLNGRSQSALAGTYGVVLSGNVLFNELDKNAAPVNPETTGIMAMSVPGAGMASGRILIFAQGLMYLGNAQGVVDQRSNKITLVSQVSHYVARLVTDGITRQSGVAVDAILSGKMDLQLSLDYFTGIIEVVGAATYFKYDPLLAQVVLDTNTSTAVNNAVSNQNKNENQVSNLNSTAGQVATANQNRNENQVSNLNSTAGQVATANQNKVQNQSATETANSNQTATALQGAATDTSETKSLNQSVASSTTNTVTNPDGSTTTNSDSTATNANNLSGASTNTNSVSSENRNSGLTKDSSLTAGSVQTSTVTEASDLNKGSSLTAGTVKTSTVTEASDVNKGSTVTAGTATTVGTTQSSTNTVTTAKYRPDLIRQSPVASSFMALTAIGVRQDTTVEVLAPFTPPTEATSFQIEVAAPTTGGATGGAAPRPNA